MKKSTLWLSSFSILLLISCEGSNLFTSKTEGTIVYEVSFPYEENRIILELYPKELLFDFKDDKAKASLKSTWGIVSSDLIIDSDQKTYTQLLKTFGDKYQMTLIGDDINLWLERNPSIRIEESSDTLTIAGYLCNKSVAYFNTDSFPPIELYHTKALKFKNPNWWNQYHQINGFLLGYEVEQYGKRMRLRAKDVKFQAIPDEAFIIPSDYQKLSFSEMTAQLDKVINEFMNQ